MASPDVQGISKVVHENEVVVFSKTYCPYCDRVCFFNNILLRFYVHSYELNYLVDEC